VDGINGNAAGSAYIFQRPSYYRYIPTTLCRPW
jgi:hypothetical protein